MNKKELIKELSAVTDLSQRRAGEIVDTVLGIVADQLYQGNEVNIADFGKFSTHVVPAHDARNPQDSSTVHVPEKTVARFKAFTGIFNYAQKYEMA